MGRIKQEKAHNVRRPFHLIHHPRLGTLRDVLGHLGTFGDGDGDALWNLSELFFKLNVV